VTDDAWVKVATIVVLGLVLVTAVVGTTIVAVLTDRDVARAEYLTFGGALLLGALGGVSWWQLRRHRWRVHVDRDANGE
jgi:protein-S-isoprenylcysteine O-methyltransferase Ste14